MKNILFIHQSAELYGSDRTLLLLLKNLDKTKFNSVVILPFEGPLKTELEKENIKVIIAPVLKLYRKMFSPKGILKFFQEIKEAFKVVDNLNKEHKFDLIYSNTLAVLLGIFYAKKTRIKHLWHVHEIIESPKIFTKLFCKLLELKCNSVIVCNSTATKDFWNINESINKKAIVISNGLEVPDEVISNEEIINIRKEVFNSYPSEIIIALVGRISRWKGQKVLLNSFYQVSKKYKNIKLVFVGSPPPNQDSFLIELEERINELLISDKVVLVPFTSEISKIWQSIDIAVVPSTEPEPFGLVAVEAMLAKKPVIGSNHGGLAEIILNNETGFLVEPKNERELEEAISKLVEVPELRKIYGQNGYQRAINEFSIERYIQNFETIFLKL